MNITPSKSPKFVDTSLKKYPFSLTRARRIFVCLKELYSAVCSSILLNISGPNLIELRRSWIGKLFSVLFFRQPVIRSNYGQGKEISFFIYAKGFLK